jgi:hypothetical protein
MFACSVETGRGGVQAAAENDQGEVRSRRADDRLKVLAGRRSVDSVGKERTCDIGIESRLENCRLGGEATESRLVRVREREEAILYQPCRSEVTNLPDSKWRIELLETFYNGQPARTIKASRRTLCNLFWRHFPTTWSQGAVFQSCDS